ncbi:RNA-directed DNA polymerase, eukaryota, reverse transcriptase zinc-binding domain protein [Tanacetum coccineum]|uniref:RNA-directed DNA polymerase, eukaryota, reverse transcriptase zinc-binding domain protein n=1 Tax=Tanacetum coccineum TaxID=301880 RepID=A0ABQ5C056_9ASTR
MIVRKWHPDLYLKRAEPTCVPLWVKLPNLPIEAWTTKGISAIASRPGKPVIMDAVTTKSCYDGTGKVGFAKKGRCVKYVNVEYSWKTSICSYCSVFGHTYGQCTKRPLTDEEMLEKKGQANKKVVQDEDGFVHVKKQTSDCYAEE